MIHKIKIKTVVLSLIFSCSFNLLLSNSNAISTITSIEYSSTTFDIWFKNGDYFGAQSADLTFKIQFETNQIKFTLELVSPADTFPLKTIQKQYDFEENLIKYNESVKIKVPFIMNEYTDSHNLTISNGTTSDPEYGEVVDSDVILNTGSYRYTCYEIQSLNKNENLSSFYYHQKENIIIYALLNSTDPFFEDLFDMSSIYAVFWYVKSSPMVEGEGIWNQSGLTFFLIITLPLITFYVLYRIVSKSRKKIKKY